MYKLEKSSCLRMQNSSYAIVSPLGSGSLGEVYKAVRLEDRTLCAVKLLFAGSLPVPPDALGREIFGDAAQ